MTTRTIVAAVAFVALLVVDYFLLSVAFLYAPAPAEWLIVVGPVAFLVAIALRLRWLVFATHNVVTAILLLRVAQYYSSGMHRQVGHEPSSGLFMIGVILFTNMLAWLVARGLPRHPWSSRNGDGHEAASQ